MPPIKAAIDNPTFARMFTTDEMYWWFSSKLVESSVRKDIVVNDPQNPTAAKREYLLSRCHCYESTMNNPRINDPITLTNKTLTGKVLKSNGDSVSLYLRNALSAEPIPSKINSRSFINYKIRIRGHYWYYEKQAPIVFIA